VANLKPFLFVTKVFTYKGIIYVDKDNRTFHLLHWTTETADFADYTDKR